MTNREYKVYYGYQGFQPSGSFEYRTAREAARAMAELRQQGFDKVIREPLTRAMEAANAAIMRQ